MPNRIAVPVPRLSSVLRPALVVIAYCGFLLIAVVGCKKGDGSKIDASSVSTGGSKGATTTPEVVKASDTPVATQPSVLPATKPVAFPAEIVTDYLTVSLRMINWYQKSPVPGFREQSDAVLKEHGLEAARPPDTILLSGDGYSLTDGKAGTDLRFYDDWFDPVAFFCGSRGDFPDIQLRKGSISLVEQGSTFGINIDDGTEIRTAEGCFVRRSGEWVQRKADPSFSGADIQQLGDLDFLKKKVTTAAEANAKDDTGRSCLMRACKIGALPSVKYLIEMGADVNFVYQKTSTTVGGVGVSVMEYRETALAAALFHEQWECARFLIEKGADVNFCAETVSSAGFVQVQVEIVPLVSAAGAGQEELVKLMLLKKANVNVMSSLTDSQQKTALMAAAANNHANIVKMLLDAGADTSIKNWNGETALQIARENNLTDIAALIESSLASPAK